MDMKACKQSENQNVYEHGVSVKNHIFQLIDYLKTGQVIGDWKLPNWFFQYREQLLEKLYPLQIVEEYTLFHDCGKPYCIIYDENGRKHFPNHAEVSYELWIKAGGNLEAATLMRMDMLIHTIKANDIEDFSKQPEAITLLLVGLAEVHANGELFGGFDSVSFKIKWNQINKRGNAICKKIFEEI